eukprot:10219136-Alexandrium_andersonii.AAC.1
MFCTGGAPAVFTAVGLLASESRPASTRMPDDARLESRGVTELAERLSGGGGTTSPESSSLSRRSSRAGCVSLSRFAEG